MAREKDIQEAQDKKGNMKRAEHGIEWDRSCTDMICFVGFIAFLVVMAGCASYGFGAGDPLKLLTPYDDIGRECGVHKDVKDYPYKFAYNLQQLDKTASLYNSVCVKECPQKLKTPACVTTKNSQRTTGINSRYYCAKSYFDTSTEFIPKYCLPSGEQLKEVLTAIYAQVNQSGTYGKYMADITNGWKPIAIMCAGSFFVALTYIFLLRWIVKPILYLSMFIIQFCFIALTAWCFVHAKELEKTPKGKESDEYKYNQAAGIVSAVIAVAYLCCMCCCWKNISLGASIMEAASDFVTSNMKILFLPIIAYALSIMVFVIWLYSAVYIYTVGDAEWKQGQFFANIKWGKQTEYIMWGYLFGLLWIVAFIICMQQFIIACLCCMWYFSGQGAAMSDSPGEVSFLKALKWGLWNHMGSVAFGSFCIALITFIRIIFEYLAKKYEAIAGKDNVLVKVITCCMRCVLYCLDKYVKFITKNAFIQIALNSSNFCTAAWESFYLIIRYLGRFSSAGMIGWILMILGKGTIMGVSAWITFLITKYKFHGVQQPFIPALIVGLFSYLVGSLFLSIFSFSCTAILHCFISDEDGGGSDRTPKSLQPFLDFVDSKKDKETEMKKSEGDDKKTTAVE